MEASSPPAKWRWQVGSRRLGESVVATQDADLSVGTERLLKLEDEICSPEWRIQIKLTWKSQAENQKWWKEPQEKKEGRRPKRGQCPQRREKKRLQRSEQPPVSCVAERPGQRRAENWPPHLANGDHWWGEQNLRLGAGQKRKKQDATGP